MFVHCQMVIHIHAHTCTHMHDISGLYKVAVVIIQWRIIQSGSLTHERLHEHANANARARALLLLVNSISCLCGRR